MISMESTSRRTILKGAGAAGLAWAMAGCGNGGGKAAEYAQPAGDVPAEFKGRTRIVFWSAYPAALKTPMDKIVNGFNAAQKDIYVDIQYQADYRDVSQKLIRGLQAKQVPDIALLDVSIWQRFLYEDILEPLDGYFKDGFAKSVYIDSFLKQGIKNNQLWWVSFNRSTPVFYYNKDAFAAAGLPDRGPQTWTELRSWGADLGKLTLNGAHPRAHGYGAALSQWTFQGAAWNWRGNLSDGLEIKIQEGGALEAAEWQRKFIFDDKMAYLVPDPKTDFYGQRLVSFADSTGQLTAIQKNAKFNVGIAYLPKEKDSGVPTGGAGLSVLAGISSERKQGAFEFIKYASRPDVSATWCVDTGYLPVIKESVQAKVMTDFVAKNPGYGLATQQLDVARANDDVIDQVPGAQDVVIAGMEKIYGQNPTVSDVLQGVSRQLSNLAEQTRLKIGRWG